MRLQKIISAVQDYHPDPDLDAIRRAYAFVAKHHAGQTRASGEPYITHVTEVALLASKLKLDLASVVAGLLHDTVEDTPVTIGDIAADFGSNVAQLVDGVTKLSRVNFSSRAEEQAENFRKMLLAMARDIRVLLIKLCDRTHNMRTLEFLSESRQVRIAQETKDIYAPLAHRLGIYWMKSELEDLSFRYLQPTAFEEVKSQVKQKKKERQRYIDDVVRLLSRELNEHSVEGEVVGRPKSFYSIYSKMQLQGLTFDEIYDLIAFRIIVPTTMDCYAALGVVHAAWKPIPGRFKDYIAMPKPNGYRSLHTAVFGPKGSRIEIQIRTQEMHDVAEKGIAAHWIYKESEGGQKKVSGSTVEFTWLKDLLESESLLRDPVEFMSLVKDDLFPHEVYVFSPRGDLIALPQDSTAIDFAYRIHSEVGHHCAGARVNGQQVPLSYKLQNGDSVEILTSKNQVPHKDWLRFVMSSKAKQRIRSWLKTEERLQSITVGKELLAKDLRKVKFGIAKLEKDGRLKSIAQDLGYNDIELLYAEIGYGKLNTARVVESLLPEEADIEEKLAEEETALQRIFQRAASAFRERSGIKVNGMEGVVFRFARCCDPLPGDELVGFVTRGRGVTIHKRGCAQTMSFDPRRFVDVTWDTSVKTLRTVNIQVCSIDRIGLLASLTNCISSAGVTIISAQASPLPNGQAANTFELKVESVAQVDSVIRAIQRVKGVAKVERFSGGINSLNAYGETRK